MIEPLKKNLKVNARVEGDGFVIDGADGSTVTIRYLGTPVIEIVYQKGSKTKIFSIQNSKGVVHYSISMEYCQLEIPATGAEFSPPAAAYSQVYAEAIILSGNHGCNENDYKAVEGKVAVVDRGGCMFQKKADAAHRRRAAGLVIVNVQDPDTVFFMSGDGTADSVDIPVLMISAAQAQQLRDCWKRNTSRSLQFNANAGAEDHESSVSVMGSHRGFVVSAGDWKVLCQRHDDTYALTYLV